MQRSYSSVYAAETVAFDSAYDTGRQQERVIAQHLKANEDRQQVRSHVAIFGSPEGSPGTNESD